MSSGRLCCHGAGGRATMTSHFAILDPCALRRTATRLAHFAPSRESACSAMTRRAVKGQRPAYKNRESFAAGIRPMVLAFSNSVSDGALSFGAEIDRVSALTVERSMCRAHHLFAHLLRMLPHERPACLAMREGVLDAAPQHAIDGCAASSAGKGAVDDDTAERNRSACLPLPELAQVDNLLQALGFVGEAVLVNDQAGIELSLEQRPFDGREQQLRLVARRRERQAEKEVGRGVFPGNRDPERSRVANVRLRRSARFQPRIEQAGRSNTCPSALPASSRT